MFAYFLMYFMPAASSEVAFVNFLLDENVEYTMMCMIVCGRQNRTVCRLSLVHLVSCGAVRSSSRQPVEAPALSCVA